MAKIIESIIRRKAGTTVEFADEKLHFKPNEHGAHVCEVKHAHNVTRLLAITEGFRAYVAPAEGTTDEATKEAARLDAERMAAEQAAREAEEAARKQAEAEELARVKAQQEAADAQAKLDAEKPAEPVKTEEDKPQLTEKEQVAAEYEGITGKKPAASWSVNKIRAEIAELKAK